MVLLPLQMAAWYIGTALSYSGETLDLIHHFFRDTSLSELLSCLWTRLILKSLFFFLETLPLLLG